MQGKWRRAQAIGQENPLAVAVSARDGDVLRTVAQALDRGDMRLAYQPIVQARSAGRVAYYEGLIRILDPAGRIIPANEFVDAVEDMDLGRQLDCRALSLGLKALRERPGLRLAVNMSARSIGYGKWMNILRRNLRQNPEVLERLILEVSESSAMTVPELVVPFMDELQAMGVTFALDDFGAGFTSFRYLKQFSFDILKIDGQFIRRVHEDADNQVIVQSLAAIAGHFDMLAVAESVESEAVAAWLEQHGIDCMQGYWLGAPSITPPWLGTDRGAEIAAG